MGFVPRGNSQGLKLIIFNGRAHAEEVLRQSKLNGKGQNLTRSGSGAHRHARNMVIKANLAGSIYSQRGIESVHPPDRSHRGLSQRVRSRLTQRGLDASRRIVSLPSRSSFQTLTKRPAFGRQRCFLAHDQRSIRVRIKRR